MIRRAEPEDAAALAALIVRAYTPWIAVIGRRPRPMDDDYAVRCAAGHAWLLEAADAALAGAVVLEDRAGHLWLDNLAVEPARQGEGRGRELLRFVEDEARRRGHGEIRLSTAERMERNIALYTRLGYVETERVGDPGFVRVFMTKRLG